MSTTPPSPSASRARARTWWAALCVALLALAGVAVPAHAADVQVVSGRVAFPEGTDHTGVRVQGFALPGNVPGNSRTGEVPVAADGGFTLELPDGWTADVQIRLVTYRPSVLATGWHVADRTVAARRVDATAVPVGATGVVVRAVVGTAISGRVAVPAGVGKAPHVRVDAAGTQLTVLFDQVRPAADGTFVVDRLVPGDDYVVGVYADDDAFYDGWLRADGTWGPREVASTFSAPVSGLTLRPNARGTIKGRVEVPAAGVPQQYFVFIYYADGVRADAAFTTPDGFFESDELDTGQDYRVQLQGGRDLVGGYYTVGGALVPRYADGAGVRPDADLVLRPASQPAIRGRVELPAGFTFDPTSSPRVEVYRQLADGTWESSEWGYVREDGAFTVLGLTAGTEYRVRLDLDGTEPGAVRSGWWAGDTSVTTTDESRARAVLVDPAASIEFRQPVVATKAPAVWGSTALGGTLSASRGTWEPAASGYRFQWLRHGKPIAGATASTYKVTKADLGLNLSVQVVATSAERPQGVARSAVVRVPRVTPKVSLSVPKTATYGQPVTVTARVSTAGVSAVPSGTVRVSYAGGSRTVNLGYADKGRVTVRLTGLARGSHSLRAVYTPSAVMKKYVTTGTSAGAALRVR